jgi:solute carrier family 25 aspartate/glutamate transporter 12/13
LVNSFEFIFLTGSIEVYQEILAGAGAGTCQVIATNPMEMVKIRMQLQSMLPEAERLSAAGIVRSLGLKGMYQGTVATLLRDVPFSIFFFPSYAHIKDFFADNNGNASVGAQLMGGTLAGALASGAVTPADVIKTRLQLKGGLEKYKDFISGGRIIFKEEGLLALYKGWDLIYFLQL